MVNQEEKINEITGKILSLQKKMDLLFCDLNLIDETAGSEVLEIIQEGDY